MTLFKIRTNGVLPSFHQSATLSLNTLKSLGLYFQSLPCAFNGNGEKVNEFTAVSHDPPFTVDTERGGGYMRLQQHADEGAAAEESTTAP